MVGNAGSMASMAMACVDMVAAASTTNSTNPIDWAPRFSAIGGALALGGRLRSRRRLARNARGHGHDRCKVGQIRGNHESRPGLRQLAELLHVFLADAQLHGLDAAAIRERNADLPQAFGRRGGHREDGLRLAFALVDL